MQKKSIEKNGPWPCNVCGEDASVICWDGGALHGDQPLNDLGFPFWRFSFQGPRTLTYEHIVHGYALVQCAWKTMLWEVMWQCTATKQVVHAHTQTETHTHTHWESGCQAQAQQRESDKQRQAATAAECHGTVCFQRAVATGSVSGAEVMIFTETFRHVRLLEGPSVHLETRYLSWAVFCFSQIYVLSIYSGFLIVSFIYFFVIT